MPVRRRMVSSVLRLDSFAIEADLALVGFQQAECALDVVTELPVPEPPMTPQRLALRHGGADRRRSDRFSVRTPCGRS